MKKTILFILLLLFPSIAAAAGTITATADVIQGDFRYIDLSCVAHTDNSFSVTLNGGTSGVNSTLVGWRLELAETKPGGTAPTDASDLTIKNAFGSDLLGGTGTDAIDATTVADAVGMANGYAYQFTIVGDLTVAVANNAVASATFNLRLTLVRE